MTKTKKNQIPDHIIKLYQFDYSKSRIIVGFDEMGHSIKRFYFENKDDELPHFITGETEYIENLVKL